MISRICSGTAFFVTATSVTSDGSRFARAHAAAIRPRTPSNRSANSDFFATNALLP
jgi:hypothetical protein